METIKDVGEVVTVPENYRLWRIPNFYDLPQEYNTVIRSPRFRCNVQDWYMEVYPDGRRLYSSSGWFGISALNLNTDSKRIVILGIRGDVKQENLIITVGESNGDGFYSCTRFLPKLLLKSWKELFMQGGDLCLLFSMGSLNIDEDTLVTHLIRDDVQEWFKELYENASPESPIQEQEENEMTLKTDVGEIFTNSEVVRWTIQNFWDLPQEYDAVIKSPRFRFKDRDWYLEIYPNGRRSYSSLGWFGINVWNLTSDTSVSDVQVSVLKDNSENVCIASVFQTDSGGDGSYCCTRLFPISLLKSLEDVVTARGNLSLLLEIETEGVANTQLMEVATKCVEKWYKQKLKNKNTFVESSTQTEGEIRLEKLGQDFREILLNGNISDITLKVKGQEFKAHKTVLAARSPVFLAMMMHDTEEKISGIVDIPDSDPSIFPDFLNYLYSGSVENLTSENAAKLYTIADKYQVNELKESCKDLMLMNISIDNFCDVFTLSLQHNQKELKEACIQFFAKNSLDIVLTCKWQTFLSENPITGNELFIKHLKLNK